MNLYSQMLIGPLFFTASWLIHTLNAGLGVFEALSLSIFLIQFLKSSSKILWGILHTTIYLPFIWFLGKENILFIGSWMVSALLTWIGYRLCHSEQESLKKHKALVLGYEKLLQKALIKQSDTALKLEVFLNEKPQVLEENIEEFDVNLEQEKLHAQELLEKQTLALEEKCAQKEQKPLKRLRRVVMKQTSFLDHEGGF